MSFSSTGFNRLNSRESLVLYMAMFVMGGCGLAYEYTLSRIASDLLGNSVRQWAIIIGVMLFFMGVGADVQKWISDHRLLDKFIGAEIVLGLLGGFAPIFMLYTYGILPSYYVLIQYILISVIGLIIGFEIPLLTRINEAYARELRVNLGGVLKMDYIGSLCGALAWVFLLPLFFTLIESAFVLGILNVLVGCFTLAYFRRLVAWKLPIALFSVCSLLALITGLISAKGWTSHAEQYLYRDRVIFSKTTRYQHIVLTESRSGDVACYINGNLQFNSFDEYIYHENLVHPAFAIAPHHENILILGGGDGLALREVLKYPAVERVVLCDIDPMMTELARKNPYFTRLNKNSLDDARLTVLTNHALLEAPEETLFVVNRKKRFQDETASVATIRIVNMDAAKFVEQVSGLFDVIIIDFPDPNTPELAKLYSQTFYRHIAHKLAADGIVVQQATSPIHAKEAFLCIGRTMSGSGLSMIPYHDNIPSFGEWGWWIGGREQRISKAIIQQKLLTITDLTVPTQYISPDLIRASLYFGKDQLLSQHDDINTLVHNRLYEYSLQGWRRGV